MRVSRDWFATHDGRADDAPALVTALRSQLKRRSTVHITNVVPNGDPLEYWMSIGAALGHPIETVEDGDTGARTHGAWMDVRFEPGRSDTFRYHNTGQPLHSDSAYDADGVDLALFYMARQAIGGGSSLFVDAATIAACARDRDPTLFDALMTIPVRFGKPHNPGRMLPILRYDGTVLKVNWNYYRVLPDQGEQIAALRERFRAFLEDLVTDGRVTEFTLSDGEVVLFKDEEVLHGRQPYTAQNSGDRLLWKSYFSTSASDVVG